MHIKPIEHHHIKQIPPYYLIFISLAIQEADMALINQNTHVIKYFFNKRHYQLSSKYNKHKEKLANSSQ